MRIDGFSSQSYPIKRKPRKGQTLIDESVDDSNSVFEPVPSASRERISQLPARQQDMIFPRGMSKNVASALTSYLTTAGFVDWEVEVLGAVDVWL